MKTGVSAWFVAMSVTVAGYVEAAPHTGAWTGQMSSNAGETEDFMVEFSEAGNPIVRYESKGGLQVAELVALGQRLRYVPPGGGVESIIVKELSITGAALHYVIDTSFEKTSGGILVQRYITSQWHLAPKDGALSVVLTVSVRGAVGQSDNVLADPTQTIVFRGILRRK